MVLAGCVRPAVTQNQNSNQPAAAGASACAETGGTEDHLTECNGAVSKICTLPNGDTCYVENLTDGKCEGVFSPKILCD